MYDTCGATRKQDPTKTCTRPAGWGTVHPGTGHCKLHGGSSPSGNTFAIKEIERRKLAEIDVAPLTDPLTELSKVAGQVCAWRDAIAERVQELTSIRYELKSGEQLRSEVALFERAMDRCTTVLVAIAKLNIDERLARITEAQALAVDQAVHDALIAAGLTAEQQDAVQRELSKLLQRA